MNYRRLFIPMMPNYNIMKDLYGIWDDPQENVKEEIYIEDEE